MILPSLTLDWIGILSFITLVGCIFLTLKEQGKMKFLRILICIILFWLVFDPQVILKDTSPNKPNLAVLLDSSKSMSTLDPSSRFEKLKHKVLEMNPLIQTNFNPYFYHFSDLVHPFEFKDLEHIEPNGKQTHILSAIRKIELNASIHGIIIFSDGIHNNDGMSPIKNPFSSSFKIPVYTVGVGNSSEIQDISIGQVTGMRLNIRGHQTQITCKINSNMHHKDTIEVQLQQVKNGVFKPFKTQKIHMTKTKNVTFKWVEQELGVKEYQINIPLQHGEIISSNNRKKFTIDTTRSKLRILYISGKPSSEYSFLRRFFKNNSKVILVSFVILRTPKDVIMKNSELSLIPFPAQEIFLESLQHFDVVLLENFSFSSVQLPNAYLHSVKNYVKQGGSLIMTGGKNSFGLGNYQQSALQDLLPIHMNPQQEQIYRNISTQMNPTLPVHPMMDFLNKKHLKLSIPVSSFHKFIQAKKDSHVIATIGENKYPAVIVKQYYKGRVLVSSLISSWEWKLQDKHQAEIPEGSYAMFWNNILTWATAIHQKKPIKIVNQQLEKQSHQEYTTDILLSEEKIKYPISSISFDISYDDMQEKIPLTKISETRYTTNWTPSKPWKYILQVIVKDQQSKTYKQTHVLQSNIRHLEIENLNTDFDFLKDISSQSHGQFVSIHNLNPQWVQDNMKLNIKTSTDVYNVQKFRIMVLIMVMILLLIDIAYRIWRVEGCM